MLRLCESDGDEDSEREPTAIDTEEVLPADEHPPEIAVPCQTAFDIVPEPMLLLALVAGQDHGLPIVIVAQQEIMREKFCNESVISRDMPRPCTEKLKRLCQNTLRH